MIRFYPYSTILMTTLKIPTTLKALATTITIVIVTITIFRQPTKKFHRTLYILGKVTVRREGEFPSPSLPPSTLSFLSFFVNRPCRISFIPFPYIQGCNQKFHNKNQSRLLAMMLAMIHDLHLQYLLLL